MEKKATLSDCGKYRYELSRIWDNSLPIVLFIMHNPSTADANEDDPTIRRCIGFAKQWGYGGIMVGNLFPYRATDPKELLNKSFEEICPIENIGYTNKLAAKCHLHILAYGNPVIKDSAPEFFDERWHYLKLTKSGNPCHPLYLKSDLKPIKMINKPPTGINK